MLENQTFEFFSSEPDFGLELNKICFSLGESYGFELNEIKAS